METAIKELFKIQECTVCEEVNWLYIIQEATVRNFLVVGEERALLIDTGSDTDKMKQIVERLTDKPVTVAITHADGDHIHCISQFDDVWMSPSEYARFHNNTGKNPVLHPIWDGDIFDLGGTALQAVMNPGHTSGCCTFLDRKNRRLIGGDSIQRGGMLYMFGADRDLLAAIHSLERIRDKYMQDFELVYPAHAECPVPAAVVPQMIDGFERMLRREVNGTDDEIWGNPIRVFDLGLNKVLYERHREFWE